MIKLLFLLFLDKMVWFPKNKRNNGVIKIQFGPNNGN